ncbi:hypothetical protein ACFLVG_01040 [Chloroflexota bacterium]
MNMDWVPWVIRAVLIVVGIIVAIMVWKREKGYSFRFFAIGSTILILGVILLIVAFITDLSYFYGLYLTSAGAIGIVIGLVVRNIWEKNR